MINYIFKNVAIEKLNNYLKTIDKEEICYYIKTQNIEKYIFTNTFNFYNLNLSIHKI